MPAKKKVLTEMRIRGTQHRKRIMKSKPVELTVKNNFVEIVIPEFSARIVLPEQLLKSGEFFV
jgi:hypothetical protein